MKPYDSTNFDRQVAEAQNRESRALPGLTVRDEANALIVGAVRNDALFEQLHAGRWDPVLDDADLSRISDAEMKQLMIRFSAALAWLLSLRDSNPDEYARQIAFFLDHARGWERTATGRASPGGPTVEE
jgi:hypothetical protein